MGPSIAVGEEQYRRLRQEQRPTKRTVDKIYNEVAARPKTAQRRVFEEVTRQGAYFIGVLKDRGRRRRLRLATTKVARVWRRLLAGAR